MPLIGPTASALISSKDANFSDIWELQRQISNILLRQSIKTLSLYSGHREPESPVMIECCW